MIQRILVPFLISFAVPFSSALATEGEPAKLALADNDRVVFLGGTFIEREQAEGFLETRLTQRFPEKSVIFRNLGWSGDTVFGLARARFGKQEDGFAHLREHVEGLKPTVIVVSYGQNESFAGEAGLADFRRGLMNLLQVLEKTGAKLIFLAPMRHESLGAPLPDPAKHNADLYLYVDLLEKAASERGHRFINLHRDLNSPVPLTDNGMHPTPAGYRFIAAAAADLLGLREADPRIEIDHATMAVKSPGIEVTRDSVRKSPDLEFEARLATLPPAPAPPKSPAAIAAAIRPTRVGVTNIDDGSYRLTIDGREVARSKSRDGRLEFSIDRGPDIDQTEALRRVIVAKNQLYFHRWRPQNETYLFGFRKHEQGQNAREIPMFDPLVAAKETEIAKLRLPVPHRYRVSRIEEPNK
ncbi:MAG: SGNH/GDSL hydrolase family protein [Isosphaeraceae bacterium]|nr:SGNH/GDSL hydrolase family protein [Isosphaeraceae bacterium]